MSTKRKRAPTTVGDPEPDNALPEHIPSPAKHDATPKRRSGLRHVSSPATASRKRNASPDVSTDDLTTPTARRTLPVHTAKRAPVTPSKKTVTPRRTAVDKSAKRKSNQRLLKRAAADDGSGEDGDDDDDELALEIADDGDEHGAGDTEEEEEEGRGKAADSVEPAETPVKRGRGRPKGSKNREVTPPTDLPAHEWYFWINRANNLKTSANTFPAAAFLSHEKYHEAMVAGEDAHAENVRNLHEHHAASFAFWEFEMKEGFNVILHGYGNKLGLLKEWADWLHAKHEATHTTGPAPEDTASKGRKKVKKVSFAPTLGTEASDAPAPITIVLESHHPALTTRSLFSMIARAALPDDLAYSMPNQPTDALRYLLEHLTATSDERSPPIYLLIAPIHAPLLTHAPMPTLLAQLSQHPRIHILATADDPHFPLLWPQGLRDQYNWVFHDGTTFASYDDGQGQIAGFGVVDTVNELLGRRGARGKGREGVRWVLRSLPENARGIYRIIVAEILSAEGHEVADMQMDMDEVMPEAEDEDADAMDEDDLDGAGPAKFKSRQAARARPGRDELPVISYKLLYSKAVEEFLCSSEMAFRGLLKEFVDHQMVAIRRDMSGQEAIGIDMRRDELEGVLEDLMLAD